MREKIGFGVRFFVDYAQIERRVFPLHFSARFCTIRILQADSSA